MSRSRPAIAIGITLLLACSACGPTAPPTGPAQRATPPASQGSRPATVAAVQSGDPAQGEPLRYECDDGSVVKVTYGNGEQARIELPDGPTISLPKAQSASKGAGDVFVGETVSLHRDGDELQVAQTAGDSLQCRVATVTE